MEQILALPHGHLAWDDIGPRTAPITLLLVHGFPHDRGLWSAQIEASDTAFRDVRILVPDLPGFGQSTPLADPQMDAYSDALAALLDAADVHRAVIAGLSMGGYVAFAFFRKYEARVQGLILMDSKAAADTEPARNKRRDLITTVECDGVGAIVPGLLVGQLGSTTRATQPAVVAQVEMMLRRAPATGVIGAATAMLTRVDSTPTLAQVSVPTLVLVGEEDTLTPVTDAIAMSAGIRGSRLVTIGEAGHLAPLEQPAVVNAAIAEFLDVALRDDAGSARRP
jgi:3-oxoadipate enol-lactonase